MKQKLRLEDELPYILTNKLNSIEESLDPYQISVLLHILDKFQKEYKKKTQYLGESLGVTLPNPINWCYTALYLNKNFLKLKTIRKQFFLIATKKNNIQIINEIILKEKLVNSDWSIYRKKLKELTKQIYKNIGEILIKKVLIKKLVNKNQLLVRFDNIILDCNFNNILRLQIKQKINPFLSN